VNPLFTTGVTQKNRRKRSLNFTFTTRKINNGKFILNIAAHTNDNKCSILYLPRLNSVVIIGCELLSVVGDVVNDVKFVSNAPVNGLVSDFIVTDVVLTSPSAVNTRNGNTTSKHN